MTISSTRTSDAQFSIDEVDEIRRAVRQMFDLSCPRCGESLRWSAIEETATASRMVSLVRCASCRRFVVLS